MRKFIFVLLLIYLFSSASEARIHSYRERLSLGAILTNIKMPKDDNWAYIYVDAVIKSKPEVVWSILCDIDNWSKWLPMTRHTWFLSPEAAQKISIETAKNKEDVLMLNSQYPTTAAKKSEDKRVEGITYEEYDLPWPLKNEWVVKRYNFNSNADIKRATWRKVASTDGVDDGHWEVKPWGEKETFLNYYYRVKKKNVPEPLFKTAISLTVNSMVKALRRESLKREQKD